MWSQGSASKNTGNSPLKTHSVLNRGYVVCETVGETIGGLPYIWAVSWSLGQTRFWFRAVNGPRAVA